MSSAAFQVAEVAAVVLKERFGGGGLKGEIWGRDGASQRYRIRSLPTHQVRDFPDAVLLREEALELFLRLQEGETVRFRREVSTLGGALLSSVGQKSNRIRCSLVLIAAPSSAVTASVTLYSWPHTPRVVLRAATGAPQRAP